MTTATGASGAMRGRGQAAADTAWTISTKVLEPKRAAVHGSYAIEDSARLPGLNDALRRDFAAALVDHVDEIVFLGDTTANPNTGDIVGLATYPGLTEMTLTQAAKVMASEVLGAFGGLIDGVHSTDVMDLRVVSAVPTYQLWLETIAASTVENQTIAQFLTASRLAWSARGGLADDTVAGSWAAFVGRARGIEGAGVVALWGKRVFGR